ncbi:MAG: hypothetical protein CL840_16960 [Crocinitomicaceae bacterium]|nr:hypothetical protein [Crocinitomicaceae bacterium]|tara:strand:+ start:7033 stop:8097 length:1065 start_codon:yes stop_codon:yes gene_type:complete
MRSIFRNFKPVILISIPTTLVTLILLELVFRFVIPAATYPTSFYDSETQILKYDTSLSSGLITLGTNASIRTQWNINAQGWNNSYDYIRSDKPLVAVIGDSYVEGFQVDVNQRFSELLQQSLSGRFDVFSFGRSGSPLSQYLHMARHVQQDYQPKVMVFTIISNDFLESVSAHNNRQPYYLRFNVEGENVTDDNIQPYTISGTNSIWKKSALVRYVFYNLKLGRIIRSYKHENRKPKTITGIEDFEKVKPEIQLAIEYFLERVTTEFKNTRILFLLDGPRDCMYSNNLDNCTERKLFNLFKTTCKAYNVEIIDLEPPMRSGFGTDGTKYEFKIDHHWNVEGHKLAAKELEKLLK